MKKIIYYVALIFYGLANAQTINIPDANFKDKLLQANTSNGIAKNVSGVNMIVDTNGDGEIQVSEALNVYQLHLSQSSIADLTGIEEFVNLANLNCSYNSLTDLVLANNTNLNYLNCIGNNLTELDLSNNPNLEILWAIFNPNLMYLNINNGGTLNPMAVDSGSWMEMWANLPSNIYICADETEIAVIEPQLNLWNATGQMVSSYCTFYPQGDYNTITGTLLFDFNNDGICDENDVPQSFIKVNITNGIEQYNAFTSEDGTYIFFTQEGDYTLSVEVENPSYFNVTPTTATVTFADNDNNEEVVNFCITPNGEHKDVEIIVTPLIPARPGFEATYNIVYRNKGNQVASEYYGLNFMYSETLMDFVFASVEPEILADGMLIWSYEDLMPFESRSIVVTMEINTPTDPEYPVEIDDELEFVGVITYLGDENSSDNLYTLNQVVVGAFDPNDITCVEGDIVDPEHIGDELHYLIRFENTGNYYAENVVVVMDVNEELYDISTLRVLNASHNVNAQVRDNKVEFFFNQIMLDPEAQGNVLLGLRTQTTLQEGDMVMSQADIYFDYNYPIITNEAVTIFESTMSIEENIKNIDLKVYPNPTTDYFNLASDSKIQSIEMYDASGRLILKSFVNGFETRQDVNQLNKGMYFLKIKTENGDVTGKVIKN
jgi:hypothetical protein